LRVSAAIGFGIMCSPTSCPCSWSAPELARVAAIYRRASSICSPTASTSRCGWGDADSGLIATRLGAMTRHVCAAPAYLERGGAPESLDDWRSTTTIDMPGVDGRPRRWTFTKDGETRELEITPRTSVNRALALYSWYAAAPALARFRAICVRRRSRAAG